MSTTLANFLFEVANFLLLAAGLGWLLFKPIRKALDAERQRHQQQDEESRRQRAEAESWTAEVRDARRRAERELDDHRKELLAAAQSEAAALLDEAKAARRAERRALEDELATLREGETQALAEAVGRLAAGAVRELLDVLPGPSLDLALVRAACRELGSLPAAARSSAVVECARPLEAEARTLLRSTLGGPLEARVVEELGAGIRITTPAGQVDATATALTRRAARVVSALGREAPVPPTEPSAPAAAPSVEPAPPSEVSHA